MHKLGLTFKVEPVKIDTNQKFKGDIDNITKKIAKQKADIVLRSIKVPNPLIIATFSLIEHKGNIIGIPQDEKEALKILNSLSGSSHTLVNAIILKSKDAVIYENIAKTEVIFKKLKKQDIENYAKTEEALSNVGAYFIQGDGGMFVREINGSYFNLVGLDLNSLIKALEKTGLNVDDSVKQTINLQEKSIKESFPR